MKFKSTLLIMLTVFAIASCSSNKAKTTKTSKKNAAYASDDVKCLTRLRTGTHIHKKRCFKKSDLKRIREESQQKIFRMQNRNNGTSSN